MPRVWGITATSGERGRVPHSGCPRSPVISCRTDLFSQETPMTTSVTRLLGLGLTPGKLRGLQRICNDNGTMTMVATDQNSSLIGLAKEVLKREPTYDELVVAKNTLTRGLAPLASAILVDGYYGAWTAMASMALPRTTGLWIRVEKSGGGKNKVGAPLACFGSGMR